jgi:ABC-type polysaccharide/polyol phosphate export permease
MAAMRKRWEFIWAFTKRELKARYKNAFFGFLWMILNPVFQMIIIGAVFHWYLQVEISNYFAYLYIGLLLWNFFSLSMTKSTSAFVNERMLVQKAVFPRESLVLSLILSNGIHTLVGLVLVLPFLKITTIQPGVLVGALAWLLIFTSGLSLLFSTLNVKFRDVSFFVQALLPIWFYATPIMYPLRLAPEPVRNVILLNPLTVVFEYLHASLLGTNVMLSTNQLLVSLGISALIVIIGAVAFTRQQKNFADWL